MKIVLKKRNKLSLVLNELITISVLNANATTHKATNMLLNNNHLNIFFNSFNIDSNLIKKISIIY